MDEGTPQSRAPRNARSACGDRSLSARHHEQRSHCRNLWLAPGELLATRSLAVSIAVINSVGQLGSFIATLLWGMAKDSTGSFSLGLSLLPIGFVLAGALVLWLRHRTGFHRAPPAESA